MYVSAWLVVRLPQSKKSTCFFWKKNSLLCNFRTASFRKKLKKKLILAFKTNSTLSRQIFCILLGESDFTNFFANSLNCVFFSEFLKNHCATSRRLTSSLNDMIRPFGLLMCFASPFSQIEMQEKFAWAHHGSAFSELTSWLLTVVAFLQYNMALAKDKNNLSDDEGDGRGKKNTQY